MPWTPLRSNTFKRDGTSLTDLPVRQTQLRHALAGNFDFEMLAGRNH